MADKRRGGKPIARTAWDPVADWYTGWVGESGSKHHRQLAIPAVMEMLEPRRGESILDIGCGHGVLAPLIAKAGARYTGVDASRKLLDWARKHHGAHGKFLLGDATDLRQVRELGAGAYHAAVYMLSIQDMDPLHAALQSAAWALGPGGRVVLLMTHPCFRVPRQSGWGWDEGRKLQYRRVDRYLTPLAVPLEDKTGGRGGNTRSFHRPLQEYVNGLAGCGLLVDAMREIPTYKVARDGEPNARAQNLANQEIPLFLALSARKAATSS